MLFSALLNTLVENDSHWVLQWASWDIMSEGFVFFYLNVSGRQSIATWECTTRISFGSQFLGHSGQIPCTRLIGSLKESVLTLKPFLGAQDRHGERHKDSRLNLRPPSHSATYATVSAWHHQPEKLILDSCGYEATVSPLPPHWLPVVQLHCNADTLTTILIFYSGLIHPCGLSPSI